MSGATLSTEVWAVVGLIAGFTVLTCLQLVAKELYHLATAERLKKQVAELRRSYFMAVGLGGPPRVKVVEPSAGEPPATSREAA